MKNNTINKKEIEKFSKIAEEWWDPNGKFKPLHKFNPIRIKYIRDTILSEFKLKKEHEPFKGLSILDIGCGGGLLSEPMARLGADVVGIDASFKNIQVAKYHLKKSKLKVKYYNSSPENFKIKKIYLDNNLGYTYKKFSNVRSITNLIPYLKSDKKNNDDKINFIFLKSIGKTTRPDKFKISVENLKKISKFIAQF